MSNAQEAPHTLTTQPNYIYLASTDSTYPVPNPPPATEMVAGQFRDELALAKANEVAALKRAKDLHAKNKRLVQILASIADLLPWRDYTANMPRDMADEFGFALVSYWMNTGVTYAEALRKVDLWWLCPTCKGNINANEDDGMHEHCEYDHRP